ncbi:hypothetical protein RKD55_000386 [Rossellomorea marisflavi]
MEGTDGRNLTLEIILGLKKVEDENYYYKELIGI